jgi:hypothetical protein
MAYSSGAPENSGALRRNITGLPQADNVPDYRGFSGVGQNIQTQAPLIVAVLRHVAE